MARNTLQNALRWQEHLGNKTTCHSCAVSQALGMEKQAPTQVYSCECGEIILRELTTDTVVCPQCGKTMSVLECCTHKNK